MKGGIIEFASINLPGSANIRVYGSIKLINISINNIIENPNEYLIEYYT